MFAYLSKYDPEAERVGEGITETRLRREVGEDHGQPHSQSKAA